MKHKFLFALAISFTALSPAMAVTSVKNNFKTTGPDEVILHAWSWSFDTIASNMKRIADAG